MMMGPNSSGRMAASIMIAHPAWQLPTTHGLPSASGCSAMTFSRNTASARDVADGLPRHGVRQEADEVAGMPRLERHTDLAVGLESADPGPVAGTRIDDHEWPP